MARSESCRGRGDRGRGSGQRQDNATLSQGQILTQQLAGVTEITRTRRAPPPAAFPSHVTPRNFPPRPAKEQYHIEAFHQWPSVGYPQSSTSERPPAFTFTCSSHGTLEIPPASHLAQLNKSQIVMPINWFRREGRREVRTTLEPQSVTGALFSFHPWEDDTKRLYSLLDWLLV